MVDGIAEAMGGIKKVGNCTGGAGKVTGMLEMVETEEINLDIREKRCLNCSCFKFKESVSELSLEGSETKAIPCLRFNGAQLSLWIQIN
jgi:hypothetical protein